MFDLTIIIFSHSNWAFLLVILQKLSFPQKYIEFGGATVKSRANIEKVYTPTDIQRAKKKY